MEIPFTGSAVCSNCSAALPAAGVCGHCLKTTPPWRRVFSILHYDFPVPYLIHRFKFQHDLTAGHLLARLFADKARHFARPDTLLAVPLNEDRLRNRGFNQSAELARHLSKHLRLPVLVRGIGRQQSNDQVQSLLHSRSDRIKNVRGVFHVKPGYRNQIEAKHLAIIDDVMTSGATAASLCETLIANGAGKVDVWVLARA